MGRCVKVGAMVPIPKGKGRDGSLYISFVAPGSCGILTHKEALPKIILRVFKRLGNSGNALYHFFHTVGGVAHASRVDVFGGFFLRGGRGRLS